MCLSCLPGYANVVKGKLGSESGWEKRRSQINTNNLHSTQPHAIVEGLVGNLLGYDSREAKIEIITMMSLLLLAIVRLWFIYSNPRDFLACVDYVD